MAVPSAPSVSVVQSGDHLEVQWYPADADVSESEDGEVYVSNVTSWEVERSADGATGWTQVRDEADENVYAYADTTANTADTEYFYRVRGVNIDGDGDYSAVVSETTLDTPGAPTGIAAVNVYDEVIVTWTLADTGETSVELDRSANEGVSYSNIVVLPAGATNYLDTGLTPATKYRYRVRAVNVVGNSAYNTMGADLTTNSAVPATPTGVTASSVPTGITVAWEANEATNIDSYEVLRSDDYGLTYASLVNGLDPEETTYTDTTAAAGGQYWYRVVVEWSGGDSKPSDPAFGIGGGLESNTGYVPNPPRNLTATANSAAQITCTWSDCSVVEAGYELRYRASGVASWSSISLPADTQSRAVTGLLASTRYEFQCRATGLGTGSSAWTPSVYATTSTGGGTLPTAPSGLTLTSPASRDFQLRATWTDNASNETGYEIEWWNARDLSLTLSENGLAANTTGFTINQDPIRNSSPLDEGGSYFARVRAYNANGNSAWTDRALGTVYIAPIVANAPISFRATSIEGTRIALAWTDTNNGLTATYELQRSFTGSFVVADKYELGGNARTFVDSGLNPQQNVWYRLRCTVVDRFGQTQQSDWTPTLALRTGGGRPQEPTPPTLTGLVLADAITAVLSWDYETVQTDVASFIVYRSTTSGSGYSQVVELGPDERQYVNTSLSAATEYFYVVTAVTSLGEESENSNELSVTTLAPATAPDPASNLVALLSGSTSALLSWTDNSDDETGFKVQRATVDGGPYSTIATTAPNATRYVDVGLSTSTTYYYVIVATNSVGDAAASNQASITTEDLADPIPEIVEATAVATSPTSVRLSWVSNSGVQETFNILRGTTPESMSSIATPATTVRTYSDIGLSPRTLYYYRVNAVNGAGSATGELMEVTTPRATGNGGGPSNRDLFSYRREFANDDDTITLYQTTADTMLMAVVAVTPDVVNGPFATLKVGEEVVAVHDPYSGILELHNHKVPANTAVTIEFSGTGTSLGAFAITVLAL